MKILFVVGDYWRVSVSVCVKYHGVDFLFHSVLPAVVNYFLQETAHSVVMEPLERMSPERVVRFDFYIRFHITYS